MTDRTRVSGWDTRKDPPRPREIFIEGHVDPAEAINAAEKSGMDSDAYLTIQHQVVDLPMWIKAMWDYPKLVTGGHHVRDSH